MLDTHKVKKKTVSQNFFSLHSNFEAHLAQALDFMERNWLFHVLLIFIFYTLKYIFLWGGYTFLLINCYYTASLMILSVPTGFVFFFFFCVCLTTIPFK